MLGYQDLLKVVKKVQSTGGLDCDEKSICDYQDMIGHSAVEDLQELSRGEYKEAFYRVYGASYGVVEALKYYSKNSKYICDMIEKIDDIQYMLTKETEKAKKSHETAETFRQGYENSLNEIKDLKALNEKQAAEIITLKARLYDLMQ